MGDCHLRLQFFNKESSISSSEWHIISKVFSADTTIREVVETSLLPHFGATTVPESISIWDCTLHPPRDITDWPTSQYPAKAGPKSKTLYDAGWFPSGVWQILPRGDAPKISSIAEDSQYNIQQSVSLSAGTTTASDVTFLNPSHQGFTPSQILHSVEARFDSDPIIDEATILQTHHHMKRERIQKEHEMHAKLEAQISKLSCLKPSKVSMQVRNMLIKSRCTGVKTLKMEDRVHLHVIVVHHINEMTIAEQYRYFSKQDTVARILSTMSPPNHADEASELLVKCGTYYRQLPLSMRLYQAIADAHLQEVDSILIRQYNSTKEEPTTSVLMELREDVMDRIVDHHNDDADGTMDIETTIISPVHVPITISTDDLALLHSNLAKHQDQGKKKRTASTVKVQQMLMKSKAKGDKKRIPKIEDRFFVQLIDGENSEPCFMNRNDSVRRLLQDNLIHTGRAFVWNDNNAQFFSVALDLTFDEADRDGVMTNFGIILVLPE